MLRKAVVVVAVLCASGCSDAMWSGHASYVRAAGIQADG